MTDIDREPALHALRRALDTGVISITAFRDASRAVTAATSPSEVAAVTGNLPPAAPPVRRGGTHKPYPLDHTVLDELAAIPEPVDRCLRAGEIAHEADAVLTEARTRRIEALITAHVRFGVPMANCYRPYGILRRPFRNAIRHAPANLPAFTSADHAFTVAREWHRQYEAARSRVETARLIRDVEVRALTGGRYGTRISNAYLAAEMRQTTARIAQIRLEAA